MPLPAYVTIIIFAGTYLVIALGKLPFRSRLDRTGAALIGASLMLATGALTLPEAYKAIDFDTITLLLGMMIVVANLRLSGFFRIINNRVVLHARRPWILLLTVTLASGIFSAFLVNDTICLVLTPLVLELIRQLRRNPVPYLLAVAMASNVGSTATITGNPQNIIIGSFSRISYSHFAKALSPIAGLGLLITAGLIFLFFRDEFWTKEKLKSEVIREDLNTPLAIKSGVITILMVVAFFFVTPVAKVAILAGSLLLFTRRIKPEKVYREVDWPLLLMFCGLFIVVAAFEKAVITPQILLSVQSLHLENTAILSAFTAGLSNLVSNVPAVLLLRPFVTQIADQQHAWLVIAMSSTLAGNFTILGSVANLIVVQKARAENVEITFWTYFKVGLPLSTLTILIGIWLL